MAYDGLMTYRVVKELQPLVGGRINKVHQPYALDLMIQVRSNRQSVSLLVSANAMYARLQLTDTPIKNPQEPPMFCMMLRKHIEGGFITAIEQVGRDRVIVFSVRSRNELGDEENKRVYIELMGRHSNVVLTNEDGKILDAIKHLPPSQNTYRTIMPGSEYILPPAQQKSDPLTEREAGLKRIDWNAGMLDKQLVASFAGMSPQIAQEIMHRAKTPNRSNLEAAFDSVMADLEGAYVFQQLASGKERFSPIALTSGDIVSEERYDSSREVLDRFYYEKANRDRVKQQAHDVERLLKSELERNQLKRKRLLEDMKATERSNELQKYGELLTTYLFQLEKGMKIAHVVDYYDEDGAMIDIPLDPLKTPNENAQRYYKKYNKLKVAKVEVQKQIELNETEISYLETLVAQLDVAAPRDIVEIREELAEGGYIRQKRQKKKQTAKVALEGYTSSTGVEFYVGKNNTQNDHLTFKFARRDEVWLHVKDIPGSHVIIRSTEPDETTLLEAATVAAYFSKARASSGVPVDYTKARYVKKPSGAKPGFVIYTDQQTVYVTPDEQLVKSLQQ
ncbi:MULTISPECIES: NFACT family protein [unclassified Exiguobacterium]|uniref:Rqc2 family fibronectin-binding protein n=1 Tax=unclassified Exiguobacterium TaxID=2644629 RepID=UPI0010392A04|nr:MULTISPECIES: NFACT RNA binding domain-containing protein [unclassified Exiguobacterium]TCI27486.1 fibronectin/fibrinogen-binding protein [Exiguobacterium sp. SH5S4]TCI58017.1 fibronectin/fibrinogen-binding protein [Exiguobacterium sp. SH5S13]TCI66169.1 fibronectin/fibrinogen-binding protein [Exiguobacterium sp. SH3S1]